MKATGYLAFQLGTSLLDARNSHALHLRNLGVNFIEHSIKNDQLDLLQLLNVKNQFWSLVFCEIGAFDAVNERVLLKEKVANCMAILACKLWVRPEDDPVQWNDFFEIGILEGVLKSQNISGNEHLRRQEFALLTISQLINIVRTSGSSDEIGLFRLSEDRRLQLHSALEISLPPFTEWLFINFPIAVASNVSLSVLNSAVNCFKSFCTWMGNLNSEGLERFLESSVLILFKSDDDELSINVLDTLQLFFSSKQFLPSEQKVLEFYLISLYPQICQLLSKFSQSTSSEESYQKLKLLIQCYLSIGNRYICHKKNPLIVKNISEIISLFISIGQLPSLSIYLDLLDFLSNLIRNLPSNLNFKDHLPQLFMLIATKMGQSMKSAYKSSIYNEIDFEEIEEFKEFQGISRVRSGDLIKNLTLKFPDQLLEFSYNSLGTFIQGGSFDNSQWEGLLLMEDYISRAFDQIENDGKYNQKYLLHLQLLMIHSPLPRDLNVLERWITCVKCLTASLGSHCPADDFRRSVENLFNLAICPDRPDYLRSHAALAILKLADSNVELFSPLFEPLLTAISPLLASNSTGASWERRLFSELILIFMSQPSLPANQQMILFSTVADPLVELLKNAKTILLSGPDPVLSLMKHLGFDGLKNNSSEASSRKFSSDLNLLLSTLQILFKRVAPLVQSQPQSPVVQTCLQVLDELVGYLMLMIQCLHRIGTRQTWISYFGSDLEFNTFYPKMQEYLEMGDDSDGQSNTNGNTLLNTCNANTSSPLVHIAGWTRHYRQTSYLVLGLAATSFCSHFYALPNLSERFMSQPLSSLESLNLADWNVLIKLLLKPVLSSAPRELIPVLVGASLNGLLVMLGGRLDQEWSLVFAANSSTKSATGAALSQEMSRESKCNNLSNGFIAFLCDLLNVPSIDNLKCINLLYALEKDNLLPRLESGASLSASWFFSEAPVDLIFSLGDFLGKAMNNWPRSVGVFSRLINLQMYLISGLMGRPDLPNRALFLSKSVNYALSCWTLPSWVDHQTILLALLTEQFKWSFLNFASENYFGPMLFDPDSNKFLKSFKAPVYSQFENELILKFKVSSAELQQLRHSLLGNENLKTQRSALRTFFTKHSKSGVAFIIHEDLKQKELSNRLVEMKKRIGRKGSEFEETENFDSLLSDLFNVDNQ